MSTRTIPVHFVTAAVRLAAERGVDLEPVLAQSGISRQLLATANARCTPEQMSVFVREMWRLADDELFGLGRAPVPRGTFRLVSLALIHAIDLREVLDRMGYFVPVLPAVPAVSTTIDGETVRIQIDARSMADPDHLLTDFILVLIHRFMGWLIARRITLHTVELPYSAPPYADDYDLIFGCPLYFDEPFAAITFDSALLSVPIVQTEQTLAEWVKHSPADLLGQRDYGATLTEQVRRILEGGLDGSWPTTDDIARRLALSPQHVRRRLHQENTSFGAIKETLLRDTAITGLVRGESVERIANRLGFSEPSAFRRAFKRWTGTTPTTYQQPRSTNGAGRA